MSGPCGRAMADADRAAIISRIFRKGWLRCSLMLLLGLAASIAKTCAAVGRPPPKMAPRTGPAKRHRNYNRSMFFIKDRRRRAVFLLSLGVVLFFALLGALQWFN